MIEQGFEEARRNMVAQQLAARHIADPRVLAAFVEVPRHEFVPQQFRHMAYEDRPIDIGLRQTISQPYMVALMTELLALSPDDRVLEVGTGSGYQSALLSRLAAKVISIERHAPLAEIARRRLAQFGYTNVDVRVGDGTLGAPEDGPFDAIVVTAGGPSLPQPLLDQLVDGGRLLCPVGTREVQHLLRVLREGNTWRTEKHVPCVFVPLVGDAGWREEPPAP